MIPRKVSLAILIAIVLLGAGLRLYHLSSVPTELIADEVDLYNSAHSIATTGRDIDGHLLPFVYTRYARNPPIYAIAGYASSLVFGKNAFGLRLPAVLFGLAAIVLMYAITLELTRRRDIALIAALVQATQPLFIQFSRTAWEPSCELPFLLGALYVLLRTFRRSRERDVGAEGLSFGGLAWGAILLALTAYTYMAGWFYAFVLGGLLIVLQPSYLRNPQTRAKILLAAAIGLIVAWPALWMWFFDPLTVSRTERMATFAHGLSFAALRTFAENYLAHFRMSFLVTTGDPQSGITWRYLNGFGAFYWWIVPFAIIGLAATFRYIRERPMRVWVWLWLVVYPLGGALTNDGPSAPRTLAGAPVFCILAAVGFGLLLDWAASFKRPRVARVATIAMLTALASIVTISVARFAIFYFTQYVHRDSNAWDSGTRATFTEVIANHVGYDRVCFSIRPAWYQIDSYVRFYLDDVRMTKIENVADPRCFLPGTLLVTDANNPVTRPGFTVIARTADVDGNPFAIMSGRPK